jgi:hypothetical protein
MEPLPVKAEGIQELVVNAFHDLAEACHTSSESLGPASLAAVAFGQMYKQCSVSFEPAPMVFGALETLIGHVASRGGRDHARKPRARMFSRGEEGLGREGRTIVPEEAPFVELTGWAVGEENESAAGRVYLEVDSKFFPAFYGTQRQDVADSLGVVRASLPLYTAKFGS